MPPPLISPSGSLTRKLAGSEVDHQYDYIIAGAGASGLSLARQMIQSPLGDKKILIVDSNLDPKNDKTWCFWDHQNPPFPDLIHATWDKAEIGFSDMIKSLTLEEYSYFCIRSEDFSRKILDELTNSPNITLLEDNISSLESDDDTAILNTGSQSYSADFIFQSCFEPEVISQNSPHYPLLQHFLGWEVESSKAVFDTSTITLMHFDDTFNGGVAFMYILPWSATSALIEYTIFSADPLQPDFYEEKISLYLNHRYGLNPIEYNIKRKEDGKIPMQDSPNPLWYKENIVNIGMQGGITKPSTGYTFRRIQKHSTSIINALLNNELKKMKQPFSKRHKAYDLWLLEIIHDHPQEALRILGQLFENNSLDQIFRFLGEESTFWEDLKIMSSVSPTPFLRAIWKTAGRLRQI